MGSRVSGAVCLPFFLGFEGLKCVGGGVQCCVLVGWGRAAVG